MTKKVPSAVAGSKRKVSASEDENLTTALTDLNISNPPKDAVKVPSNLFATLFASDVSQTNVTSLNRILML